MVVVPSAVLEKQAAPDLSFWEECKRQAEILNIPAFAIVLPSILSARNDTKSVCSRDRP